MPNSKTFLQDVTFMFQEAADLISIEEGLATIQYPRGAIGLGR